MPTRAGRFVVGLVVGLTLVTWAGSVIVDRTTRAWFERDITLRAHLAANGARQALMAHWSSEDAGVLQQFLADLTRDERVMAAAACGPVDAARIRRRERLSGRLTDHVASAIA